VLIVPTYLEKSPIHGFGVFARTRVEKGARVWEFHEKLDIKLTPAEFDRLPLAVKEELKLHMYEPERGGTFHYEATMGKYMNHSRSPNVDFSVTGIGVATRDIEEGEELTCDYRDFMSNWADYPYI
jgi:SET domain-containing protein